MPHLTDHDLRQMDEAWLQSLSEATMRVVLQRVVADLKVALKEARARLNQNSDNSSRPPGSRPPRENRRATEAEDGDGVAMVMRVAVRAPPLAP